MCDEDCNKRSGECRRYLAEAKQINEDRAAEVVDDFCETEETAEDTAEATEE